MLHFWNNINDKTIILEEDTKTHRYTLVVKNNSGETVLQKELKRALGKAVSELLGVII